MFSAATLGRPTVQRHAWIRLTGNSKFTLGVNVIVNGCLPLSVSPAIDCPSCTQLVYAQTRDVTHYISFLYHSKSTVWGFQCRTLFRPRFL